MKERKLLKKKKDLGKLHLKYQEIKFLEYLNFINCKEIK